MFLDKSVNFKYNFYCVHNIILNKDMFSFSMSCSFSIIVVAKLLYKIHDCQLIAKLLIGVHDCKKSILFLNGARQHIYKVALSLVTLS